MLTLPFMGTAALLTICAPLAAQHQAPMFYLSSTQPGTYVAAYLNTGHMMFTFSNFNDFPAQIDGVNVSSQGQDAIHLAVSAGTTCGVDAFLPAGESCTVEVAVSLIAGETDSAGWGLIAVVDAHRAGDGAVTGIGIEEGFVYLPNPRGGTVERAPLPPVLRPKAVLAPMDGFRRARRRGIILAKA